MISTLSERIAALAPPTRTLCERIFRVVVSQGRTVPPPTMEDWIAQQFGAHDAVREQTITRVINRLTLEEAIFNPLRARRPNSGTGAQGAIEDWIAEELAEGDMFRLPERDTTADVFGRLRGRFCTTAANVAKYEGWHGLVIFDEPHPLRWDHAHVIDYVETAGRWLLTAHAHDPEARYPIITWNCLPKSGATLMHGHMQIALARGSHYARVELWRRAAAVYHAHHAGIYFDDLAVVHAALGLTVLQRHDVQAFAHLTPLRNREVVLLAASTPSHDPDAWLAALRALAAALYAVLRALVDGQDVRAFNVALALPPLGPRDEDWAGVPIIARLGDRGAALACSSDIGAMELFAAGCIVADPFDVASRMRT